MAATILFCSGANAQTTYPKGVYLTFEDISSHAPAFDSLLVLKKRSLLTRIFLFRQPYVLKRTDKSLKKKTFRKALAYSDGEAMYLNCRRFGADPGYAKVKTEGRYLATTGIKSLLLPLPYTTALTSVISIPIRQTYALNTESGSAFVLTTKNLKDVLKYQAEILSGYENTPSRGSAKVKLYYLNLYNQKFP